MENLEITTKEARVLLFKINSNCANNLRKKLFDLEDQDAQLPSVFHDEFNSILKK